MTARYADMSDPTMNPQFRRKWEEPPRRNGNRRPGCKPEAAAEVEDEDETVDNTDWDNLSMAVLLAWRRGRAAP